MKRADSFTEASGPINPPSKFDSLRRPTTGAAAQLSKAAVTADTTKSGDEDAAGGRSAALAFTKENPRSQEVKKLKLFFSFSLILQERLNLLAQIEFTFLSSLQWTYKSMKIGNSLLLCL